MSTKYEQLQKRVEILESYCENIGGLLEQCAEEVTGYKPMIAGTGLDVEVANLVNYLRSELDAEKLNTANMIALSNERDALKDDNFTVREQAMVLTRERDELLRDRNEKAAALKVAQDEISKQAQEIIRLKAERDELLSKLAAGQGDDLAALYRHLEDQKRDNARQAKTIDEQRGRLKAIEYQLKQTRELLDAEEALTKRLKRVVSLSDVFDQANNPAF